MISYVTNDFNFNIFSRFSNKIVLSKNLVKNKITEVVKYSKINFISNEIDIQYAQTKSFFFSIYVEYDIHHVQFTFEVWFSGIDQTKGNFSSDDEKIEYLNNLNLGENVTITNYRVYNLNGRLIDMISYDKKIWVSQSNNYLDNF